MFFELLDFLVWLQQTVLFSRCVSVGYHLLWSVGECLLCWFWAVSSLACADQYSVGDFRGIPCRYSCSLIVQISSLQYAALETLAILALRCPITASQIRAPVLAYSVIWKPTLGHSLAKWLQMSPYFFLFLRDHIVSRLMSSVLEASSHMFSSDFIIISGGRGDMTLLLHLFQYGSLTALSSQLVIQLCLTLHDPLDCSLPGSSVHGILQARILGWVAISSPRRSSQPRDWTQVYCITGRFFTFWVIHKSLFFFFSDLRCKGWIMVLCNSWQVRLVYTGNFFLVLGRRYFIF